MRSYQNLVPSVIKMVSADLPITSNAATNITDLTFPVLANKKYLVRGCIHHGCSTANGSRFAILLPAGATMFVSIASRIATNDTMRWGPAVTSAALLAAVNTVASNTAEAIIMGTITIAGTAGDVVFQGASATNLDTTTIYSEGSFIELIPAP